MPKLYSAKIILSALQRAGFVIISQKGSHIKLYKKQDTKILTVIVPNHKEIAIGTFGSILRQANLNKQDLEKLIR
ncbi:MAG: type II toxin-antitoxin system HicA family toxin [Candidatus Daviesbacteria bacterium]|nr:type II toxin-antitoxin system HicA family toxin [Candidatus Daviesbacteria bacterium]